MLVRLPAHLVRMVMGMDIDLIILDKCSMLHGENSIGRFRNKIEFMGNEHERNGEVAEHLYKP